MAPALSTLSVASVLPQPTLHQPFIIGPGFWPIPGKLVGQIVTGKFVDLDDFLLANNLTSEPELQLLFDGRLILTPAPKKSKRRVEDISTWVEAFSIFCLVLTPYFPHHWKDLLQYQLLILRTYRQFNGRVWLAYGFKIGFFQSQTLQSAKGNKPSAYFHLSVIEHCLTNKVSLGRVAGPFRVPPFPDLYISSFRVIPKKGQPGKWCLIVDLSFLGGVLSMM